MLMLLEKNKLSQELKMQKETLNLTAWEQMKEKVKRWFGEGEYGT